MTEVKFRDVPIGGKFYFSALARSGLLADLDRPNTDRPYVKLSARVYGLACEPTLTNRVGSVNARAWVAFS